ncbi:MAG: hypothetical protein HC817_12725 [Saprospiraceae bacterium]|nr:hypothetical protein [Saprospiraceae bacterium]
MKDLNELFSSDDLTRMTVELTEEMTREELADFLKLFRKDYYDLIDFSKGYEVMDEVAPFFVPKAHADATNAFDLLIKATSKAGDTIYF